ncbi:TIGR01777 family oxidoreductase [Amycolatopsis sp. OK19-0408]|uniref:TIGR01777 family oxidoreductase n=1 Tax=Amycolatopsis iheyensis TaxID=2945988 RepID=A0A9X2N9Z3_9PSEU|nr:TIGR01777 family oxidoreductase [Amycolatopsis iheyensis]MCR6483972.1 TIGR01777 family oxidoreductase [Amycolatopsis iheyensis]
MKVVIPGGTGHLGRVLSRSLVGRGHEVVVLTRREAEPEPGVRHVRWDGRGAGKWTHEIDGGDVVLNLAGRSVNCRYTQANLREMWNSRIDSARVVGGAIERAAHPPRVWLQMSTATIYAHRHDAPNDETTGVIGGDEPGVPAYWAYSVDIARAWEREQRLADTPHTRKVALRTAMVMSPEPGGAFEMLLRLTRLGLGGPVAGGRQYMSWIHEADLVRVIDFLIACDDVSGPVNLAAPEPLPYRDFLRELRAAARVPFGLPATRWMAAIGAFALRSDPELLLKSRRVVPGRLLDAGFEFDHPEWRAAAVDLVGRTRSPLRTVS